MPELDRYCDLVYFLLKEKAQDLEANMEGDSK